MRYSLWSKNVYANVLRLGAHALLQAWRRNGFFNGCLCLFDLADLIIGTRQGYLPYSGQTFRLCTGLNVVH